MACYFRAAGAEFAVDTFLQEVKLTLPASHIWRRGEPQSLWVPGPHPWSGFRMTASEASFQDVFAQIDDATKFLQLYAPMLAALALRTDVEDVCLDFGIEDRPQGAQADGFPPNLLLLLGQFKVSLVVSRYPFSEEAHG
jgi:hypothetical protein